jgi:hypothetical protein
MTIHTPIENPGRVDKECVVLKNVYWQKTQLTFLKQQIPRKKIPR